MFIEQQIKALTDRMTAIERLCKIPTMKPDEWRVMTTVSAVAEHYGLKSEDILGRNKERHVLRARQVATLACVRVIGMTFHRLGKLIDRNHGTVSWNVRKAESLMSAYPDFKAEVEKVFEAVRKANK
jgi:chromosomal replication initiation ATPase DnaA